MFMFPLKYSCVLLVTIKYLVGIFSSLCEFIFNEINIPLFFIDNIICNIYFVVMIINNTALFFE